MRRAVGGGSQWAAGTRPVRRSRKTRQRILELGDKNAVNVLGGTDHKHIAGVKYEDISISTGPSK